MSRVTAPARSWEVWDRPRVAEQIDDYWRGSPDELQRRRDLAALVKVELRPGDRLLEVGCGTGLVYEALAQPPGLGLEHIRYTGLDNSRQMLKLARNRYPQGTFKRGDAFALTYKDNAFDVACAFEVFGHMPDCATALAELLRVSSRVALFTLWVYDGVGIQDGGEHYVYPLWLIRRALIDCQVRRVPVGPTVAFVVSKEVRP